MIYQGCANGAEAKLEITAEGLRLGARFLDFADLARITPLSHRVLLDTLAGERIEISMLGFSYDGFFEELTGRFADRSLEALFVEGAPLMRCEGDYETPFDRGRGIVALYSDAVCILPPSCHAVRIPLSFAASIRPEGYRLEIRLIDGSHYAVSRMGYDTKPFAERAQACTAAVQKERAAIASGLVCKPPFTHKGLFRTAQKDLSWQAAFGSGGCAVELETGDDAATYLYRVGEQSAFFRQLSMAMEAMGPHRELIWMTAEQLAQKPLCRMAVQRSAAVRFLRAQSAGRIIHNAAHAEKLAQFLNI